MGDPHISLPYHLDPEFGHLYPRMDYSEDYDDYDPTIYVVCFPMMAFSEPHSWPETERCQRLHFLFAEVCYLMKKKLDVNDFRDFYELANRLGSTFNELETYYMMAARINLSFEWEDGDCWVQVSTRNEVSPYNLLPYLSAQDAAAVNVSKGLIETSLSLLGDPNATLTHGPLVAVIKAQMLRLYVLDVRNRRQAAAAAS